MVGDRDAIAMFPRSNQPTKLSGCDRGKRIRVGRSILGRELTLKRADQVEKCSAFGRTEKSCKTSAAPMFLLAAILLSVSEFIRLADELSQPGQRAKTGSDRRDGELVNTQINLA